MAKRKHFRQHPKTDFAQARKVDFQIENIDSLGQGVSKLNNEVHFIAKTLPGETGTARVLKQKKNVGIARVDKLDIVSDVLAMDKVNAKILIHGDMCHFQPFAKKWSRDAFASVRTWVIDKFHMKNHKCEKRKWTKVEKRHLKGVNTSMSEMFNGWVRHRHNAAKIELFAYNMYEIEFCLGT